MAGRIVYNPDAFRNLVEDDKTVGFSFEFKLQYYRGITLSIIRDIKVIIDGEEIDRENVRVSIHGETFTLDQCKTVVSPLYRWEFGEFGTVEVLKEGGLAAGHHHIKVLQHIAPSYMPFPIMSWVETEFDI